MSLEIKIFDIRDHPFKTSAFSWGRGQNLPNLPTDSTKKTANGRGQKSVKNCRRLKWMGPKNDADGEKWSRIFVLKFTKPRVAAAQCKKI